MSYDEDTIYNNEAAKPLDFNPKEDLKGWQDCEIPEEELVEFLRMLWDIAGTFARMSFYEDPVQQAMGLLFKDVALDSPDAVKQIQNIQAKQAFNDQEGSDDGQ